MRILQLVISLVATGLVTLLPGGVIAQDYPYPGESPPGYYVSAANLDSMLRRIEVLEAAAAAPEVAPKDPWIDVSSEKFTTKVGGRVQYNYVLWTDDSEFVGAAPGVNTRDYIEARAIRIRVEGEGYGVYEYLVELDFEPAVSAGGTSIGSNLMKDVYVGIREVPFLGTVRIGHYKPPFSMEQLTSSRYISFLERSMADSMFVQGRELGVAQFYTSPGQNLTFGTGAFIDNISENTKERLDSNMGLLLTGRTTWTPYYDEPSNGRHLLHLGVGMSYSDVQASTKTYAARPETHLGDAFINTGALPISEQVIVDGEIAWVNGPFSIQAELFAANADRADIDDSHDYYGGYVFASYFLTGENRVYKRSSASFDRVVPNSNFWMVPGCHGPGAVELLLRWSHLDFSDNPGATATSYASQMNNVTLGLTWYWTPQVKHMLNYAKVYTDGRSFDGLDGDWFGMSTRFEF